MFIKDKFFLVFLYMGSIIKFMENNNFNIQEELKKLPARPGVYLMHDERDEIIYVGKAISLKKQSAAVFSKQQK